MSDVHDLSDVDIQALNLFKCAVDINHAKYSSSHEIKTGWYTLSQIKEYSENNDFRDLRKVLLNLADLGYLDQKVQDSIRCFRFSKKGAKVIATLGGAGSHQNSANVDATWWTGKTLILTDQKVISDLRVRAIELRDKVNLMHFQSNSERQDIMSLTEALVQLSEMAEPDLTIIDRILHHPKLQATAALIAAVATIRGAIGL